MSSTSSFLQRLPAIRVVATLVLFHCLQGEARGKDIIPPATTTNLSITSYDVIERTVTLHWTLSGDDACVGQATSYSVRKRFNEEITAANWSTCSVVDDMVPGTTDHITVEDLLGSGWWYFALKATDDAGIQSAVSYWVAIMFSPVPGIQMSQLSQDGVRPAPTTDLHIIAYTPSPRSVTLSWTPSGDDSLVGQATGYIVRKRLGQEITEANWSTSTDVGEMAPGDNIYVTGLPGNGFWYFALKATDEVCHYSAVSNNDCIKFSPSPPALCGSGKPEPPQEENATSRKLAITAVSSNPTAEGGAEVSFTLASGTPATLEVFNVAGRRVEVQDLSQLGPGANSVQIGARLAAGIYVVRLHQGSSATTRRVVLLQL